MTEISYAIGMMKLSIWLEKHENTVDELVDECQRFASAYDDYNDE